MLFGKRPTQTYVIASPMAGTLLKDGEPLAHTKIIRRLWWNGNEDGLEQEFITDGHGRFSLPVHEEQLSIGKLTQFACSTYIEAEVGVERFELWYNNKFEDAAYAETNGRRLNELRCEISNKSIEVRPGVSSIMTVCRWDGMPQEHQY